MGELKGCIIDKAQKQPLEAIERGGDMTKKQMRFVYEYLIDLNASKAAVRAGYSEKFANTNASKLLHNTTIKAYIDEQLERIHNEKTADAQEVLEYLTSVMRGEQTEQTLRLIGDGIQTIADIEVSTKERLKAAELIGKRFGMFTDKVNLNTAVPVIITGEDQLED